MYFLNNLDLFFMFIWESANTQSIYKIKIKSNYEKIRFIVTTNHIFLLVAEPGSNS